MAGTHQDATGLGPPLRADARASAAGKGRLAAAALAALVLAACGAPTPPSPPAEPPAPQQPAAPALPAPQAATPKLEPVLTPLDRYKRAVAQAILQANAPSTYDGVPPHMLRAVIVLQLTVDGKGAVTGIKTLRSRNNELAAAATKSVRATRQLPAPPRELLKAGRLEFAETWLFRDDGKFQVRSVAEAQAAVVD
jgi:protein TonB